MRPHLGDVEGMHLARGCIGLGHQLDLHAPGRVLAAADRRMQVTPVVVEVGARDRRRLDVGQGAIPLQRPEVPLHPRTLAALVPQAVGVAAISVHVPQAGRDAAIGEQDGDLVQRLGREAPEVPLHRVIAHARARVALLRVDEVGELQGVTHEEHGGVVAHQVPVAFPGVELQREAARVARGVGRAELTGDGGEAREHGAAIACVREQRGTGVGRQRTVGGERAVCARTLGMHYALRYAFAVEVRHLLHQLVVLHQQGAAWSGALGVLVVGDADAGGSGEGRAVCHGIRSRVQGCQRGQRGRDLRQGRYVSARPCRRAVPARGGSGA